MRKRKKSDRQEGVSWTLNIDGVTYRNFDKMQRIFKVPFGVLSVEQKFSGGLRKHLSHKCKNQSTF